MYNIKKGDLMESFFNFLNVFFTAKDEVLKDITKEDDCFYIEYINNSLIRALNTYIPNSFINNLPLIPETVISKIKKHIISHNKYVELGDIIETFISYVEPINLINLLGNIDSLQITYDKKIDHKSLGYYSLKTNTIHIFNNKYPTLSHEFLHAASSQIINGIHLCGFSIGNEHGIYFEGLNEGFTELFNHRIFKEKIITYKTNVLICRCLELMFDNPKDIETAYFNNDFDFIYETFLQYGTKEEFAYLCKRLDYFSKIDHYIDEAKVVLDFLYDIISRTKDNQKLEKFKQITEEITPEPLKQKIKKIIKKNM